MRFINAFRGRRCLILSVLFFLPLLTSSQETPQPPAAVPSVNTTGWNDNGGEPPKQQKSWLEQHGRFAFVIVVGLVVLALVIWYIVRSVKGMRKRLKQENENQMHVLGQLAAAAPVLAAEEQTNNKHHPNNPSSLVH